MSAYLMLVVLLVALQAAVAYVATRWPGTNRLTMREERVSQDDLVAAVREHGMRSIEDAEAVVLEASGDLSVIPRR